MNALSSENALLVSALAWLSISACAHSEGPGAREAAPASTPAASEEAFAASASADSLETSAASPSAAPREEEEQPPHPFGEVALRVLPAPPFAEALASTEAPRPSPRLRFLSDRPNSVTDEERWLEENGLVFPMQSARRPDPELPSLDGHPARYRGLRLLRAFIHEDHRILQYGRDFGSGRLLVVLGEDGSPKAAFDFLRWTRSARDEGSDFTAQHPIYAQVKDAVLYVSTGHRTYARESGGQNAYLSAIDLASGALLWQSRPLVANARNFLILGEVILTGYGFTAERDYLFVLDRATGEVLHRRRLRSGPRMILEAEDLIHVRAYDRDYVFAIEMGRPRERRRGILVR